MKAPSIARRPRCRCYFDLMRLIALLPVLLSTSCAPMLVSVALGVERVKADVTVRTDSAGTVFSERKPRQARAALVLLHGFGGSKDHWTPFIDELPDDLWIIAPDLWGFGESARVESESYDLYAQSERLTRFLRERGVERYHLVGSSIGAQLAATHALKHPDDVLSLVLMNPLGIRSPVPSPMDELTDGARRPLKIESVADFDALLSLAFVEPPPLPTSVKSYFADEAAESYDFHCKIGRDMWRRPAPMIRAATELRPPTLVIWGDGDKIIDPSVVPLWRSVVPGGLVVVMRETGHGPMLERPAETAQLVETWWTRLSSDGPPTEDAQDVQDLAANGPRSMR
jgi:pimeloyl-ACP methyl ester carboxylesterase